MKPRLRVRTFSWNPTLPALIASSISTVWCLITSNLDKKLPFSIYLYGDSELYLLYARSILSGQPFDSGIPFHPPVAAWTTAGFLSLGVPVVTVKLISGMIMAAAVTALVWDLVRRRLNATAGLAASTLVSLSFAIAVILSVPGADGVYLMLSVLSIRLLLGSTAMTAMRAIPFGAVSALACLTRGEHLILIPVYAVLIGYRSPGASAPGITAHHRLMRILRLPWAVYLATWIIMMSPWMIRNYRVMRAVNAADRQAGVDMPEFPVVVPVTLYGPLNFALANSGDGSGGFSRAALPEIGGDWNIELRNPVHRDWLIRGYRIGARSILSDPRGAWSRIIRKLAIMSGACELGFTAVSFPTGLSGIRRSVDLFEPDSRWFRWIILVPAVTGMILVLRRDRFFGIVLLIVILHRLLVGMAFFGYVRHGALLLPVVFILVSAPLCHLENTRASPWMRGAISLILAAGISYHLISHDRMRGFSVDYQVIPGTGQIDQQQEIRLHDTGPMRQTL